MVNHRKSSRLNQKPGELGGKPDQESAGKFEGLRCTVLVSKLLRRGRPTYIYIYMYIMHEPMTINDYQCYECHISYTCWYNILFIDDAADDDDDEVDVHDPFEL